MSVIESARKELERTGVGSEDTAVMIEIMRKFFDQWDSGGAVSWAIPVLIRLLNNKPLSPLTGADDEWVLHDCGAPPYYQNRRCSSVFKDKYDTPAYDIDVEGRPPIMFPYTPPR